jgi:hypothetical protein
MGKAWCSPNEKQVLFFGSCVQVHVNKAIFYVGTTPTHMKSRFFFLAVVSKKNVNKAIFYVGSRNYSHPTEKV